MNIIQHVFPPLGFLSNTSVSDNMMYISSDSFSTTILSPCLGNNVILLTYDDGNFRAFSPLVRRVVSSIFHFKLSSVFLYSKSYRNTFPFLFQVLILNF